MLLFHPAETVTGRLPLRTGLLSSVYALVAFAKWLGEIFYVRGRHPSSKGRPRELPRHFLILKANKRGISTPLISAVSPAAAPFQTSCALLISPFFLNWQASGLEPAPYACTCHRIQHRGSTCQHLYLKRMTQATDSNCCPSLSGAALTIHKRFYSRHPVNQLFGTKRVHLLTSSQLGR